MVQQMIAILLGLYLLGEAIAAAADMDRGDKCSRVAKYMLVAVIGLWMIFNSNQVDVWHLTMALALSLFVWPKMLKRIDHLFDQFIGD